MSLIKDPISVCSSSVIAFWTPKLYFIGSLRFCFNELPISWDPFKELFFDPFGLAFDEVKSFNIS